MKHKKLYVSLIVCSLIFSFALCSLLWKNSSYNILEVMNNMVVTNWGLSFQEEGKPPVIDVQEETLKPRHCELATLGCPQPIDAVCLA